MKFPTKVSIFRIEIGEKIEIDWAHGKNYLIYLKFEIKVSYHYFSKYLGWQVGFSNFDAFQNTLLFQVPQSIPNIQTCKQILSRSFFLHWDLLYIGFSVIFGVQP